jgi:hypothetical protein
MAVVIPDDILHATGMSVPELQHEFALFLFA